VYEVPPRITARDKPLALYVFAEDQRAIDAVLAGTTAGGTCINNAMIHFANSNLPFGGVGPSGLGSYHGYHFIGILQHNIQTICLIRRTCSYNLRAPL